jgi:hypothetical protein
MPPKYPGKISEMGKDPIQIRHGTLTDLMQISTNFPFYHRLEEKNAFQNAKSTLINEIL